MHIANVAAMTTTARRPRNSLDERKNVIVGLERPARQQLKHMAQSLGTSQSALTQWLIENVPLDDSGRPVGWPIETRMELPINAA